MEVVDDFTNIAPVMDATVVDLKDGQVRLDRVTGKLTLISGQAHHCNLLGRAGKRITSDHTKRGGFRRSCSRQ